MRSYEDRKREYDNCIAIIKAEMNEKGLKPFDYGDSHPEFVERFGLRKYGLDTHDRNKVALSYDPDVALSREDKDYAFCEDPFISEEARAFRRECTENYNRLNSQEISDSDLDVRNFTEPHPDFPDAKNIRINPATGSMTIID